MEVGTAFIRIRPTLGDEERHALEALAALARSLADGVDSFLTNFPSVRALDEGDTRD